ncbi:MAG: hypothetical protein KA170_01760 [Candidatus Promineofilum sp.]|nr:hypothetical protein [Promineifilum sp.]
MRRVTVLTVCLLFVLLLAAAVGLPLSGRPVAALTLAQPNPCEWTGVWLPFEGEWRLAQNGPGVSGSYLDGKGLVRGTVDGNVLRGEWKEPPSYSPPFDAGHFTVTMTADCSGFAGTFGLGDAECCNVLSAIRDENAPPSLAVEVERGTLIVAGQTIPAGATYFPPSCAPAGRSPTDDCATFVLGSEAGLKFSCFVNRFLRVLLVLENVKLNDEDSELLMNIIATELREKCGLTDARLDDQVRLGDFTLELAVGQGAAHIAGVVEGQTISVAAGPATSVLEGPGSFLAGYDAAAGKATFHAYTSPLDVQPLAGAAFILPPYSRVEVTASGPGPVTSLPHLYLPMQQR